MATSPRTQASTNSATDSPSAMATYLDLLTQAGVPPTDPRVVAFQKMLRETPYAPRLTQAFEKMFPGVLPDRYHVGAGGHILEDGTTKGLLLKTAAVFAAPFAAMALAPSVAAPGAGVPTISSTGLSPLGLPGSTAVSLTAPGASAALPTAIGATAPVAAKTATGWGKAIADLIPLGLQVGGNLINRSVVNSGIDAAQAAQAEATKAAQQRIDQAQETAGNVYNQQRQDYQGTAGIPFQALGKELGMDIPTVGPVSWVNGGQFPQNATLADMAAAPPTPAPNPRMRPPDAPIIGHAQPRTLADLATPTAPVATPQQVAQEQSASGYVRLRSPEGEERDVPMAMAQQLIRRGAVAV